MTGVHTRAVELAAKQLELLKQAVPGVTRVAMLGGLSWARLPPSLEEVARSLEREPHCVQVREPRAFDSAFAAMSTAHVHALLVFGDPCFAPHLAQIAALAAQHQLPSICLNRRDVEAGCLMSYGLSQRALGQRIAVYVDKILRGAKPADLPVEQLMRFEFVINLTSAQALSLTIPPTASLPGG
jgi:putative ABC transport system substrate-binding protein